MAILDNRPALNISIYVGVSKLTVFEIWRRSIVPRGSKFLDNLLPRFMITNIIGLIFDMDIDDGPCYQFSEKFVSLFCYIKDIKALPVRIVHKILF